MDLKGRDPRYTLDIGDASLFQEMSIMSIDNRTLNSPPEPVAASTVVRGSANRDYADPKGSFLDCEPWSGPPRNDMVPKQSPVACISFNDHCLPRTTDKGQGYPVIGRKGSSSEVAVPIQAGGDANRSSLGIIPPEMMQDNSFFNIEDVSSSELLNFGPDIRNTHQSNRQPTSHLCGASKDSCEVDSSNEQTLVQSYTMGTVKKQMTGVPSKQLQSAGGVLLVVQTLLGPEDGKEEGEEAEASICEVQFEDAELADLDDDFSDFGELHHENEPEEVETETNNNNNYQEEELFPIDDHLDINKEECPLQGPLAHSDSPDTGDELEIVRSAMREALNNDRQNGVGSCEEMVFENNRPGLEGGSGHFSNGICSPNTFSCQSTRGVVVMSPVPGDGGGWGDGSSAPGSEDERFASDDPAVFVQLQDLRPQVPQNERRIQPVGDETRDSVGMQIMVNQPVLDSIHFKPLEMTHNGVEDSQQIGDGLAEESSYHFENFLQNQAEGDFSFGDRNSLGSFGASPENNEARHAFAASVMENDDFPERNGHKHEAMVAGTDADGEPVSKIKKTYVSSESPVYLDENGAGVTDLAFQTSLTQEAAFQRQMFQEWEKDHLFEDPLAASICNEQEEFLDKNNALMMLENDEKQFQEENLFIKDDKMEAPRPGQGLGDESWVFKTSIYMANSTRMVDRQRQGDACMRISIGEFMRSRSEALGSLDGDPHTDRPQFGDSIITPPSERAPVTLLKQAPCNELPKVFSGTGQDGVGDGTQGQQQSSPGDQPLTMEDINLEQNLLSTSSGYVSKDQKECDVFMVEDMAGNIAQEADDLALSTMSRMSEVSEMSGMLSLSAITNLISSASPNCKPQDLVNMVLTLSNAKAQEKKGKAESSGRALETIRERSSAELEEKVRPKQQVSRLPVRTSSNSSPGEPSQVQRKGKSGDAARPRKTTCGTAPCNRSQPLGSTEPTFKPDQTVTLKQLMLDHTSWPAGHRFEGDSLVTDGDRDEVFSGGPKPLPDGQEAEGGAQRATAAGSGAALRDASVLGGDSQPAPATKETCQVDSVKKVNQSPASLPKLASCSSPEKALHSTWLSDMAKNMTVDLSKVEPSPDFTLSDYILEGNERSYSPADGRDTDGRKATSKPDDPGNDEHVFKKPDALPVRNTSSVLVNKSAVNRQEKSKVSGFGMNTSRQSETNKASKVSGKHGANKENQLSATNRQTFPDKILENKKIGGKSLGPVPSRTKQGMKAQRNNFASQSQVSGQSKTVSSKAMSDSYKTRKPVVTTKQQNVEVSVSSPGDSKELDTSPLHPTTMTTSHPHQVPSTRHQLTKQPLQQPHQSLAQVTNVDQHQPFTPVSQYSLHPTRAVHQYSHPSGAGRLRYTSLDDQSMLTFDAGLPAYQSTPFYHALSPHEMTDLAVQCPQADMMKTPSLATVRHTAPESSKLVELPNVVSFVEVCCVGVSTKARFTIRNTSDHWLECVMDIRRLTISEQDVDLELKMPFIFNQKIIVEPQSKENIAVMFVPKREGFHVARMAVLACPVVQNKRVSGNNVQPEFVILKAMAEMPNIEVLSESYLSLVYGELRWGSCKGLPLTLVNHGKATVPLRLSISANSSGWHCFSFEQTSSNALSIISGSSHPSTPALSKTVLNVTLKACTESDSSSPLSLMVYCKLPERESTSVSLRSPPEVIQAKMDIEVDTPSSKLTIGMVNLHAVAGEVKLLTSIRTGVLEITSFGERATCDFKLQNGGNLAMNLSLQPREHADEIKVLPPSITVKPQEFQDITVVYCPISRVPHLETVLLMAIEPEGPVFEVTVIANCLSKVALPVQPEVQILCNKSHLSFGGVEIGKAGCQQLNFVHRAKTQIKLKLEVTTEVFQIKTVLGHQETFSNVKEVFVNPWEKYSISVAFLPTALMQFQGKLIIRHEGSRKKYFVPLTGNGGTSNLVLEDSADSSKRCNYVRNIGEIKVGKNNVQKFTVWNIGSRAAFVKVFCFSDLTCSQILSNEVAIVQPNEFVIKADSSKSLVLVLNPRPVEAARCQDKPSVIGAVKFYYGDEINRRLYRREMALKLGMKKSLFPQNHPLSKVNFDVHLQDETDIEEGAELLTGCPDYQATFLKGISRMVLSLKGDPPASESPYEDQVKGQFSGKALHSQANRNRLAGMSPVSNQDMPVLKTPGTFQSKVLPHRFTSPSEDLDMSVVPSKPELPHSNLLSGEGQEKTTNHPVNTLEVYPKQLIIDLEADGNCKKKGCIQVQNLSDVQLSFEVSWPHRRLGVEFDSGVLSPRSICCLYVSPSPVLISEAIPLPWTGRVRVDTQVDSQAISVLVRRSVEEKKVSNMGSRVFSNHGEVKNSQHFAGPKPQKPALPPSSPRVTNQQNHYPQTSDVTISSVSSDQSRKTQLSRQNSCVICLLTDTLEFASWGTRQTEECKAQIKNNDSVLHRIEIIPPQEPFYLNHTAVKIRAGYFVKLPIEFRPRQKGSYEGVVVFKPDEGQSLSLKLKGTCR